MGSQLGFLRGERRPNDILWLDPIDFQQGRMSELRLAEGSRLLALGAMSYTYLKLTLSLRKAGFDAVLLDYDWRRDIATLGAALAGRIAADGRQDVATRRPQHGRVGGACRADASRRKPGVAAGDARHAQLGIPGRHPGGARHLLGGAQAGDARSAPRRRISRQRSVLQLSRAVRVAAKRWSRGRGPVRPGRMADAGPAARCPACCAPPRD